MSRRKRKLTAAEKAEKARRRREYMTVFINGKQKRVKRAPAVDGIPVDAFIRQNADPIWLLQNEMYEELYEWEQKEKQEGDGVPPETTGLQKAGDRDEDLPF